MANRERVSEGYVVECYGQCPMQLDSSDGGLCFTIGGSATVFPTRVRARTAIAATLNALPDWNERYSDMVIRPATEKQKRRGNGHG